MTVLRANADTICLAEFLAEVRRRASGHLAHVFDYELRDPLAALRKRMQNSPHTGENQTLLRILELVTQENENITCRSNDVAALGSGTLLLLSALIDDLTSGRYSRTEMQKALLV